MTTNNRVTLVAVIALVVIAVLVALVTLFTGGGNTPSPGAVAMPTGESEGNTIRFEERNTA